MPVLISPRPSMITWAKAVAVMPAPATIGAAGGQHRRIGGFAALRVVSRLRNVILPE
ncbi:MAG: hypothetical protein R2851_08780 [Caldilineaceae bacterium]